MPVRRFVQLLLFLSIGFVPCVPGRGEPPESPDQSSALRAKPGTCDRFGDPLPEGAVARLGSGRWRIDGKPLSLRYSPDGKTLIALAENHEGSKSPGDRLLHRLDAGSGKLLGRLEANLGGTGHWCLSADGRLLAQSDEAPNNDKVNNIVVRDLATGKVVFKHSEKLINFRDLFFTPDNRRLITIAGCMHLRWRVPPVIRTWEVATGKEVAGFPLASGKDGFWPKWLYPVAAERPAPWRRWAARQTRMWSASMTWTVAQAGNLPRRQGYTVSFSHRTASRSPG